MDIGSRILVGTKKTALLNERHPIFPQASSAAAVQSTGVFAVGGIKIDNPNIQARIKGTIEWSECSSGAAC